VAAILIIEDDPLVSRMYQAAFKFEDFRVSVAHTGREGLELLKVEKPTVILLDVMMPEMSGIEVLTEIKDNPKTKNIPVIVLTNLSGTVDAEKALELGAVQFIVKSQYKPKEIVSKVKDILRAYTRDEVPEVHGD
jgi:DNA-binding response OmpR family regulator